LRARGATGDLFGLMIHDMREKDKPPVTITAKRGRVVMEEGVPTIVVFDGMRQQFDDQTGALTRLYFAQYTIEIKGLESESVTRWRQIGERTLTELFHPDMTDPRDRAKSTAFVAEINNRLLSPFNAIGFTLISLAGILLGPFNRRGQNRRVALAALLVVLCEALNLALVSLMKKNLAFVGVFYAATLLPIVLGLWLLHLPGEQMLMAVLRKWHGRGFPLKAGAA